MEKIRVDLHMHTIASDGTQTPRELLDEVLEKDIKIFAITDHDSVENVAEMMTLAEDTDRIYIPGVEISTTYDGKELHLLTYNLHPENEVLKEILAVNKGIREYFNLKIIEHFVGINPDVSVEGYEAYERNPKWGGWKAENYLRDVGAIHHIGDLFTKLNDMDEDMIFSPTLEIIPKLKAIGATVILAHPPAYYRGEHLPLEMMDDLRSAGIDGMECFSPYYKEEGQSDYYTSYCKKYGLMITCGSDYHGAFIKTRHLGYPERYLNELNLGDLI